MIAVQAFHYERAVRPAGPGIVEIVPDGSMWAHAAADFRDLRIVDARGNEVPWRRPDRPAAPLDIPLPVIDRGRRGRFAVARVRTPHPVDRVTLVVPDKRFVGVATVYGADGTEIGSTQINSVGGATPARSTTVLLRPNDYRTLEVSATGVTTITRVTVREARSTELMRLPATVRVRGATVTVDLGHANVPVDELRISAATPRYNRAFGLSAHGSALLSGRLIRLHGTGVTVVPVDARGRFLSITIANGNDRPLRGLRVTAWARPRPVLIEGGHRGPLTVYYGARVGAPSYDFARLPVQGAVHRVALGPEQPNPQFRVVDRRSFFARHAALVTAALALAAALLVAAGAFALRRT